ncbi:MAG: hypothetical protein BJ554DRAFT_6416, partial [Olpidium bornovanus]
LRPDGRAVRLLSSARHDHTSRRPLPGRPCRSCPAGRQFAAARRAPVSFARAQRRHVASSPLPLAWHRGGGEIKKAAKTLRKFIHPGAGEGPDKVIPQDLLDNAKGLAIITVIKAGFVWSGRAGSGIVVARLPDGSTSLSRVFAGRRSAGRSAVASPPLTDTPSARSVERAVRDRDGWRRVTEYVFILNTVRSEEGADAVKAFSLGGNLTLGANISIAAGPVGRTAEAAGAVRRFAAVFSYSKSKGLFAALYSAIRERNVGVSSRRASVTSAPLPAGSPTPPYSLSSSNHRELASNPAAAPLRMPAPRPVSAAPYVVEKKEQRMKAMYDFAGERPGDLPFKTGDVIIVSQKDMPGGDAGWWRGRCNGKDGLFPSNYCTAI